MNSLDVDIFALARPLISEHVPAIDAAPPNRISQLKAIDGEIFDLAKAFHEEIFADNISLSYGDAIEKDIDLKADEANKTDKTN